MSQFKREECIFCLENEGIITEDWRFIYFYEDSSSGLWFLRQGIDDLGYIERGNPVKDVEKPFCQLADWLSYRGYKGAILNTNKTLQLDDFYYKEAYSLSNFLCSVAKKYCRVVIRDPYTKDTEERGSSLEKFVKMYSQVLYKFFNGENVIDAFCKELSLKSPNYMFSFFKNVNGILYLSCQSKADQEIKKLVEVKCI